MSFENNLAAFGKGYAYFGAIIATIICVLIFIISIYTYSDPDIPPEKPGDHKRNSMIMIIVAAIILTMSWGWVWLTNKSKFAAEAGGIMGGIDIARSIFSR